MQYISFNPRLIVNPHAAELTSQKEPGDWGEVSKPPGVVHVRFYPNLTADDQDFPLVEARPPEAYLADHRKYRGWKLATAWAGAVVGSWALLIGCVMAVRALWP